jgi:catalase
MLISSRSDASASNTVVSPSIASAASSSRSRERLASATRTPSRASAAAMPRPIPRLAPITSAARPEMPRSTVANVTESDTVRPMARGEDLYEQLIDAANAIYGSHPHRRALHAKGIWCEGTFTATPAAASLSRAPHFGGDAVPVLARFSTGGGNPDGHDARREARGMAVKLRLPNGEETDILATTAPTFIVRTPEEFLDVLRLRAPDPDTGQPDMEKLGSFLAARPESQRAVLATLNTPPPASFATLAYRSPHAFKLVNADGDGTWVRYRWRPEAGEATIPDEEAEGRGRNYLSAELEERLSEGPVAFELLLQLAADEDPLDDPTAVWPDDRELVVTGRLEITGMVEDPEANDHIEVFDPLRLVDGIEPSSDPVLHARRRAYSVSAYRRLGAKVEDPSVPPEGA